MTEGKPIVFTSHAVQRMKERGTTESSVLEAIASESVNQLKEIALSAA